MNDEPLGPPGIGQPARAAKPEIADPGRMFVTGRVLDPQGKLVPNATVMVNARIKMSSRVDQMASWHPVPIGHGRSDVSGLYRFDARGLRRRSMTSFALSPCAGLRCRLGPARPRRR